MKFLQYLQNIKLTSINLLDISYIIVLLPIVFLIKIPIFIFIFIFLLMLYFTHEKASKLIIFTLFSIGIIAIFLSLYGSFSLRGLSRLKLFLELLIYILIVVVALQRLTREINFYLLISPILFLALSLFFFQGLSMLIYVVFEIFIFLWLILTHRMNFQFIDSFRNTMIMFLYSLPWVILLFIFFPRISFGHASYGFKGDTIRRTGHDGTMYLDNKSLLVLSNKIVMEVGFEKDVPPIGTLYFRGSTLYTDKGENWVGLPSHLESKMYPYFTNKDRASIINYKVSLYPTQQKWIYLLDMPFQRVDKSSLSIDLISTMDKTIKEPIFYQASSNLRRIFTTKISPRIRKISLAFDKKQNPKLYQKAEEIKTKFKGDKQRIDAIVDFFHKQNLKYTLKPFTIDTKHSSDSFLFDTKKGYCVHFASSFATMSRMVGVASRVVTGYKSDKSKSVKNYLPIRQRDAHAWVELYLNGAWTRYEPTSMAVAIDNNNQVIEDNNSTNTDNQLFTKVNLYLMYIKYQVESWILNYSNLRQLQLLQYAKDNPQFIIYFTLSIISIILFTFVLIAYFRRPSYDDIALTLIYPLIKTLEKQGYIREKKQTLYQYLIAYKNVDLVEIANQYQNIYYADDKSKESIKVFKVLIKRGMKEVKISS